MSIDVSFHQKKLSSIDENWKNTSLMGPRVDKLSIHQVFVLSFEPKSKRVK